MNSKNSKKLLSKLAPQQLEVLKRVCKGYGYKSIAEELFISLSSVKNCMTAVYVKLDLSHLSKDDRKFQVRLVYCPLLEEVEETLPQEQSVLASEPKLESASIAPDEEEIIDVSQKTELKSKAEEEIIAFTPIAKKGGQEKMDPGKGRRRLKLVLVLAVAALIVFGGWQGLKLISKTPIFSSGSAYKVGEWHKEEDLWFRVYKVEISDPLYIYFEIWNKSSEDIFFTWTTQQNISLVDNTGTNYVITEAFKYKEENVNLPAGTRYDLERVNYWADPLYEANVTELLFSIEYFSRIDKATWRIPVNK